MKRILTLFAFAAALAIPSTASATGSKSYDFCGGSYSGFTGFAFCASVTVSVAPVSAADGLPHVAGAYRVTMDIMNRSGLNGSYLNSTFMQIGLDNLDNDLAWPTNIQVKQGGNVICSNILDLSTSWAQCFDVREDRQVGGGVRLDFLATGANGTQDDITSCTATVAGLHTCPSSSVQIAFDVTKDFNPNNGVQVYLKAQSNRGTAECETGTNNIRCTSASFPVTPVTPPVTPPVTATPEPATMTLLASGIAAVWFYGRRRRRQPEPA